MLISGGTTEGGEPDAHHLPADSSGESSSGSVTSGKGGRTQDVISAGKGWETK